MYMGIRRPSRSPTSAVIKMGNIVHWSLSQKQKAGITLRPALNLVINGIVLHIVALLC